jgi:Zn-dependent protease with chaperone function
MPLVLLLTGVTLLALPGAARHLGQRLEPAEWARLCLFALVVGAVAAEVGLMLVAAPTALRAAGVPMLAAACEHMLRPLEPGGPATGWSATMAAIVVPAMAAVGALRARRTQRHLRIEPWIGRHDVRGDHELVVLPAATPLAVAVGGPRPQIVISEGLQEALSPGELHAVLRHEAAHLAYGHHRYLLCAGAVDHAFSRLPFARRSSNVLRAALERWADEAAAGAAPEPRAEVRSALLEVTRVLVDPGLAAFSAAETVVERLDALDGAPPQPSNMRRAVVYLPCLASVAAVAVALGFWVGQARALLAMAGRCPT